MAFHWTQAVAWLFSLASFCLAALSFKYLIQKDQKAAAKDTEARLRALEVAGITDRLENQHQLELMRQQLVAAQSSVQEVRNLLTLALKNGS